MGLAFTIDTPLKVSQFGIDSVISLVDDILMERLRKMYCKIHELPYKEINDKIDDFRAKRITAYLDMVNELAEKKFEEIKNITSEKSNELKEFFQLLPDSSKLKQDFKKLTAKVPSLNEIKSWVKENLSMGSIDVNIMTKLDKVNYKNGEELPSEYNDAHAALRGFANSDLTSSLVLSAGMNPRLYSYIEQFEDFYPNENGTIKKKIVLKVSDYRSAMIQGKFLAKKGLWVSEYRIESGLNCGGHAFATDGYLMGPILAEFRDNKLELIESVHEVFSKALGSKNKSVPSKALPLKITAQGGVGTAEEHQFLLDHYQIDSVGWGSPFLLVPEAATIDETTIDILSKAGEDDYYVSNTSPLGVSFNSVKGNTKDRERDAIAATGKPGFACTKKFLVSSREYTEKSICTASKQYQKIKIGELDKEGLKPESYQKRLDKITEKTCLCEGLATAGYLAYGIENEKESKGVSVCPGPNLAYFHRKMSLKEMVDHIYGKANMILHKNRPNMFVKELKIYMDFLANKLDEAKANVTKKQQKYLADFAKNLKEGIEYYTKLFNELKDSFEETKETIISDLEKYLETLNGLNSEIEKLELVPVRT